MPNLNQPIQPVQPISKGADYTLLLKRLSRAVIQDNENPKIKEILSRKEIWEKLSMNEALEWAGLAQIAGLIDTAIDIYDRLVRQDSSCETAWKEYLEILDILGRKETLVSQIRAARQVLPEALVKSWVRHPLETGSDRSGDVAAAAAPFIEMKERQSLFEHYLSLFRGREDVFARQWADHQNGKSGYIPIRRPFSILDLEEHLKGLKTYGFYLMTFEAKVWCGMIDADLTSELRGRKKDAGLQHQLNKEKTHLLSRIRELSRPLGLFPVIEISGYKGFHFWFFMTEPASAPLIRQALMSMVQSVGPDLKCFDLEVFPKQDRLTGKGLGNLVKLPLGIHRLSGKRSFFPECRDKNILSQLSYLARVKRTRPDGLRSPDARPESQNLVLHPKMKAFSEKYPDLFDLEQSCPPLGAIISASRETRQISVREEKILFQTLGFLPEAKSMLHYLMSTGPDYNPHQVDYKLSQVRGTPLGCRRIHSLTGFEGGYCPMAPDALGYLHPLIHLPVWKDTAQKKMPRSEKIENLKDALENMKSAIIQIERFIQ